MKDFLDGYDMEYGHAAGEREPGTPASERTELGRDYLAAVERLGFA